MKVTMENKSKCSRLGWLETAGVGGGEALKKMIRAELNSLRNKWNHGYNALTRVRDVL